MLPAFQATVPPDRRSHNAGRTREAMPASRSSPELAVMTVMVLRGFTGDSNAAITALCSSIWLRLVTPVWAYRPGQRVSRKFRDIRELHSTAGAASRASAMEALITLGDTRT